MILLDTHVLVWLAAEPRRLSRRAARAIRAAAASGGLGVASITLWELAVLFARGRLRGPGTVEASIQMLVDAMHVVVQEVTPTIAAIAAQLPEAFPRDPADRLIAATAIAAGIPLVTRDAGIRAHTRLRAIW